MIRYLVASLLLFGLPVSPSWGEDCLKLVANKYCLGGSFSKARDTFKNKEQFLEGDELGRCLECKSLGFLDDHALGLDKPFVMIEGRNARIFLVHVCQNTELIVKDQENQLRQFKQVIDGVRNQYGEPAVKDVKKDLYTWNAETYAVSIRVTSFGPCVLYTDVLYMYENKDIFFNFFNKEGF